MSLCLVIYASAHFSLSCRSRLLTDDQSVTKTRGGEIKDYISPSVRPSVRPYGLLPDLDVLLHLPGLIVRTDVGDSVSVEARSVLRTDGRTVS